MIDNNEKTVMSQLAALRKASIEELKERWCDFYGTEPPKLGRTFLMKRLAYRIQEIYYGGLTKDDREKIAEINRKLNQEKERTNSASKILPGTRFVREWNGDEYTAIACENGFKYEGKVYRSLSAIANKITGTNWNGLVFFGLKKRGSVRRTAK